MRSLWSVTYVGAHTATTVKKLQRLLNVQALEQERERYVLDGEHVERAVFFVEHEAQDWAWIVQDLLARTSLLASSWQMSGDVSRELVANVRAEYATSAFNQGLPPGLREVGWSLRRDQEYERRLVSGGSSVVRW